MITITNRHFSSQPLIVPIALMLMFVVSCASPPAPEVDTLTTQLAANGRAAYARGAYPQAVRFYEQALQRARAQDDGPEIARNGYNLAACQLMLGRPAEARASLREALAEFGRYRMDSQPALLLDAKAAQAIGQLDEAQQALDLAFLACKSDAQRRQIWQVRGEWAADAGNAADAALALRAAGALDAGDADAAAEAAQHSLAGRVAMLEGQAASAAQDFDAGADAWQTTGQARDMAHALSRAGDALLQSGDALAAADRYYRAGRSRFAQGDPVGALQCVQSGLKANALANDPQLQALLTGLFDTIKRSVEAAP